MSDKKCFCSRFYDELFSSSSSGTDTNDDVDADTDVDVDTSFQPSSESTDRDNVGSDASFRRSSESGRNADVDADVNDITAIIAKKRLLMTRKQRQVPSKSDVHDQKSKAAQAMSRAKRLVALSNSDSDDGDDDDGVNGDDGVNDDVSSSVASIDTESDGDSISENVRAAHFEIPNALLVRNNSSFL